MSKYPTIPDFSQDIASMAATLRVMKQILDDMTNNKNDGHRGFESLLSNGLLMGMGIDTPTSSFGVPTVFMGSQKPINNSTTPLKAGDLWIETGKGGRMYYWTGFQWSLV